MSYTPPPGDEADFTWVGVSAYTPPPGDEADFTWVPESTEPDSFEVHGTIVLGGVSLSGVAFYDNRNPLRASTSAASGWTQARQGASAEPRAAWADPAPVSAEPRAPWQRATGASAEPRASWRVTEARSQEPRTPWQPGKAVEADTAAVHKSGIKLQGDAAAPWAPADTRTALASAPHRQGVYTSQELQVDPPAGRPWTTVALTHWQRGAPADAGLITPWGLAIPVPPGTSLVDPGEPEIPPREISMRLVFACPAYVQGEPGRLVFGRVCGNDPLAALIVIPTRSLYMVHNSVTLTRLPAGTEFQAASFTLDIDADSWTFGWSASLHSSARAHLVRSTPGERVEVQALANGQALRLVIDSVGRDRQFPADRISVRGRGLAAELEDVALNFGNTAARTAQQLMADVLTVNGVSFGWTVDWQIQDWLVPAGVWLHQGSYISALQDIAGAAGAYLQPHFTDKVIRVLPRYAEAPWDWATLLTPDLELPLAATTLESTEEVIKPAYNRVYVGGVSEGVFGPVDRNGTAGDVLAPQVAHPLITAAEVHRQRGLAVLSDTGVQEHLTLKTLLLPEMGIVMPGKLVRYVSDDGPRLGLVRKTAVSMSNWPVMHQTLGVQTHVE